jgi:NAD(P)-dependent dehydrogenase (short-subunit alcohol dehydrogenase family)
MSSTGATGRGLRGQTVAITGPTSGVGRATALALADQGARLFLLCRDAAKGQAVVREIRARGADATLLIADLGSLASVDQAALQLRELVPRLDVLINNAGVFLGKRITTPDGLEEMFAVNHLAHFLLTRRLLPALMAAPAARVIHVSSGAHAFGGAFDSDDYNWTRRRFRMFAAYGASKLANLLFNLSLAQRLAGTQVTSNALHPGAVATGLGKRDGAIANLIPLLLKPFFLTPEQGARTSIFLATDPGVARSQGQYFVKCAPRQPHPWAQDSSSAARLWTLSERLLAERGIRV